MLTSFPIDRTEELFQALLKKFFTSKVDAQMALSNFLQMAEAKGHRGKYRASIMVTPWGDAMIEAE